MPGLPSLGEKGWAHPLPLATIAPGAWHRYTPPCLCAPWHPSHSLICHSLTLALSTSLALDRLLSGPGQHLSPLPFSHLNGVLSIVRDIKWWIKAKTCLGKMEHKWVICRQRYHQSTSQEIWQRVPLVVKEEGVVAKGRHSNTNLSQVVEVLEGWHLSIKQLHIKMYLDHLLWLNGF